MSTPATVVLRRTWPQRIVITATLAVVAAALASAWFLGDVYASVRSIPRVTISGEVLLTDTAPGAPVNFLLIGEDSALGLPADDPVNIGREYDPSGNFQADSISIVRVNPTSGQAWVLSVPRDLLVEVGRTERRINSTLLVGGPTELISAISDNFGIPINHYITLDFLGFRRVVDELDGIPVWFNHPARDLGSGLDVAAPGCQVLNGVQALQYVRGRKYEELIDDRWTTVGNSDFGRIERQQDFLVLALERAISRGARNPATLASLLEAGANSVVLDSELTISELVQVGEAFSDFNPENLERLSLEVFTDAPGGIYQGERLSGDANDWIFEIFRGVADFPANADVSFDLFAAADLIDTTAEQLAKQSFQVANRWVIEVDDTTGLGEENVIVHSPEDLAAAESIARWLLPIPRLVEDDDAETISVVLGSAYEQVLFIYPHEVVKMRTAVAGQSDESVPDLSAARPSDGGSGSDDVEGEGASAGTTSTTTTTVATTTTTTTVAPESGDDDPASNGIIGRAPEGETCR